MKLYKFAEIYCKQAGVVIPFPSKDPNQEKLISALDDYFDEFVRPIVGKAFYDIENGNFPKELSFTTIAGLVFLISAPIVGSREINQISPCFIK